MKNHAKLKRWLARIVIVIGLFAVLVLGAVLAQSIIATQKLKTVHTRLEQESIPLSWSELYDVFPNVEIHLAAQSHLFSALDGLANIPSLSDEEKNMLPVEGYATLPEIPSNLPPTMVTVLDGRLQNVLAAVGIVRKAISEEPFWLVPPTDVFDDTKMSRLAAIRQAARLFKMFAVLHSELDDPVAASEAVIDGFRLAAVPNRGSLLIDELVRFACEGIAIESLERVLAKTNPSDESLQELKSILSDHRDMRTGILGEIIHTRLIYDSMSESDIKTLIEIFHESSLLQRLVTYLPIPSGWVRMNEAYHLEFLHHVTDTWHLPWPDFTNRYAEASSSIPRVYFLPILFGQYTCAKSRELRAAGAWRCGRIAIAIKLYSQKHGNLPSSLTDLVPTFLEDLPTEPFYGQPFEYTNDGKTGTLRFAYPDSDRDFNFRVFADRESTEQIP